MSSYSRPVDWFHIGSNRPQYTEERHCTNCEHSGLCWQFEVGEIFNNMEWPANFELRDHWSPERYDNHMRNIIGQHCNNYMPRNEEARARLEQANRNREEQERIKKQQEKGWDW